MRRKLGQNDKPAATFQATGLNHVALNVASVPKSRDWYIKHLGLKVIRESGEENCFLGGGRGDFFLTLFHGEKPGLNHYCYTIREYNADKAEEKLKAAGLKPRVRATGSISPTSTASPTRSPGREYQTGAGGEPGRCWESPSPVPSHQ